ncbi:uncharacterized protein LOC124188330 [Daphnia pulex]|uniref:uncharacterized protein LOC124188330 n=1 Tax=Daphnia pulex TaxID=6669 RepID=UPI001EDC943F|nr:uncharacterized protein LOC124188330 [Daphnia pulex]
MKYFYLLFLFAASLEVSFGCPLECSQVTCAQSFNPFDCPSNTLYSNTAALCGCCPGCVRLKGPNEVCQSNTNLTFDVTNFYTVKGSIILNVTDVPPVVASQECAPGLTCDNSRCSNSKYTCTTPDISNSKWSPECDIDGSHKALQCKSNGADPRCFCYSKEGKRIFGSDWNTKEKRDKMKCQCARLVDNLTKNQEKDGYKNNDLTYHCSSNGNFEPLQCNRGMCYCANTQTGQPVSFVVNAQMWKTLPCYNATTMGFDYLKICDSQANALALIKKEMRYHGGNPITLAAPQCDPDGSFYAKQCDGNQCYCRSRANENIGTYSTQLNTDPEVTQECLCARDKVIFQDANKAHEYICNSGGDYEPMQTIGGSAFCMDRDGFITSEYVPVANKCTLPCKNDVMCPVR